MATEFSRHGYSVFVFDKNDLDITDFEKVENKINEVAPEIVLNAAAHNAVDEIEKSPDVFALAKKINGEAVGELTKLCKAKNILLIHYSSDYVFRGDDKNGYDENAAPNPVSKYGESKALGEKLLLENADKFYLIRLSKLFGQPAVGAGAKKSFADTMIWLATEGGKTHLDLVDEEISSPTYAPDLAKFTRELVEASRPYGVYHGANSGACTWYEFGKKIFELKKINMEVAPVAGDKFPRPAKRPMYSRLLNTKLPAQRSWQAALAEYLSG